MEISRLISKRRIFVGGTSFPGEVFDSGKPSLFHHLQTRFSCFTDLAALTANDLFLSIDSKPEELKRAIEVGIPIERRGVITFEPECAVPWQSRSHITANYSFVVNVGQPNQLNGEYWPQNLSVSSAYGARTSQPYMLAANKLSFSSDELYSLRRQVAIEVNALSVYGSGWDRSFRKRLAYYLTSLVHHCVTTGQPPKVLSLSFLRAEKGFQRVEDKRSTLEETIISIVIENSLTYSSEKAVDSIAAQTIPVYVGPSDCLPQDVLELCVTAEPSLEGIIDAIARAELLDYSTWCRNAKEVLQSTLVEDLLSHDRVFERIVKRVEKWVDEH